MRHLVTALLAFPVGACTPDVPDAPSFQQHVQPILAANCVRCHGVPAIGGAASDFRLDMFGDTDVRTRTGDIVTVRGAASNAVAVAFRSADDASPMPPRFPLDDWQIETLERWSLDPVRGAPRPDNQAPTASIDAIAQTGATIAIELRVRDADPDIVGGVLRAKLGATVIPLALVHSGINRIAWDTTMDPRADYALDVVLDDGAGEITLDLGSVRVEAP